MTTSSTTTPIADAPLAPRQELDARIERRARRLNLRGAIAIALPPAAWAAHGLTVLVVTSDLCARSWASSARVIVALVTLVALALSLAGAALGFLEFQRTRSEDESAARDSLLHPEARPRAAYVGLLALVAGVLFAIGIAWAGIPSLALADVCGSTR